MQALLSFLCMVHVPGAVKGEKFVDTVRASAWRYLVQNKPNENGPYKIYTIYVYACLILRAEHNSVVP